MVIFRQSIDIYFIQSLASTKIISVFFMGTSKNQVFSLIEK